MVLVPFSFSTYFTFSWKKFCVFGILAFLGYNLNKIFIFNALDLFDFEIDSCPFCYNLSFCDFIENLTVETTIFDFILGTVNRKYVFFGSFNNHSVVIKRLASRQEIIDLNDYISHIPNYERKLLRVIDFYDESLMLLNQSFSRENNKIRLCPTLENADLFFKTLISKNKWNRFLFENIWTTLQLNPEPVLLQVFNREKDWPVPRYFGSCGLIALEENCGNPIRKYLYHPWIFRVHVVEQLLLIAHDFTFKDPNFGIYLKDISMDNVVLNRNLEVRVIDLEHVILVDKQTSVENQPRRWSLQHRSQHYECEDCFIYSPVDICQHYISDHNFYAVCKEFLRDRHFLHSVPNESYIDEVELKYFIKECIEPSKNISRFQVAEEFRAFLTSLKIAVTLDGGIIVDECYLKGPKLFAQLLGHFQFGRETDEVMGFKFYKDFILASKQIYTRV